MVQGPAAYFQSILDHCGSGLARDSGLTVNIDVECYGVIAGKPAPTGFCVEPGILLSPRNDQARPRPGCGVAFRDQSVSIRECLRVSFMVMYTSNDTAMHAVTYQ